MMSQFHRALAEENIKYAPLGLNFVYKEKAASPLQILVLPAETLLLSVPSSHWCNPYSPLVATLSRAAEVPVPREDKVN